MAPTTLHNWLGIATLVLHLMVVVRLLYLEQERLWFGPEDGVLIILAETSLALQLIDGLYLSVGIGMNTRVMHHLSAFAPAITSALFAYLVLNSAVLAKGRRAVRYTLFLFAVNSAMIFLSYWVSVGAAMGWWLNPESWTNEMRR